jgi:hypothetical protein
MVSDRLFVELLDADDDAEAIVSEAGSEAKQISIRT